MPKLYAARGATNNILNACIYNRTYLAPFWDIQSSEDHVKNAGYGEDMYSGVLETWSHSKRFIVADNARLLHQYAPCFHAQTILDAYNITHVNYLSVDAEGSDEVILRAIDWSRFSADVISFEWTEEEMYYSVENFLVREIGYEHVELVGLDAMFFKKKIFDVPRASAYIQSVPAT